MTPRDRKLIILQQLSQESEPISLPEFLVKLQGRYNQRTVRRWLNVLIEEGFVQKSGTTKAAKYVVISKHADSSSCFSSESLKAIEKIKRPLYERQPCGYNQKWFESYIPNSSSYLSSTLKKQLFLAGKRAENHDPAGTYAHQIFNRLLIDLSYNSSRLEGNTYSLLDTEKLLLHGDSAAGKLEEEKIMILNHKEAIRYLVDNAERISLNRESLYTLHYLLSDGLLEAKYSGKVRDHYVRISGSAYLPLENSKMLDHQLNLICEKGYKIVDPFEQSIFMLIHISYLQAFADVNKRTARLSANIPLIQKNLVPQSFNDVNRDDYISALLAIYELQNTQPMVDLFAFSYLRTCVAYDVTIKSIGYDAVRVRYRKERRALIRDIVLKKLTSKSMEDAIRNYSKIIPDKEREDFIHDVDEDLDQLDASRLVGLGITLDQLEEWKNHQYP